MAFGIQGFGLSAQFQGVSSGSGGGFSTGGVPFAGASASAFQTQQALGTLLGAFQQLQVAYQGMLGLSQPFPGQPGFGSGNGFFPSQPSFGSGTGFFPGQPGFGSSTGFFPSQPSFGSGIGFFPSQPSFGSSTGFFPSQPSFGSGVGFFPSQPSFGSGVGFFPSQPSFGSGNGFFPGQPSFGSSTGFFPSQPSFGSGSGFFPGQPSFSSGSGFFPSQPSFGSGNGFFPSQPSFGSGNGFFPGQPGFGSGNGFFPGQPSFGSGIGFFPGQPSFGSGDGFFPGQTTFPNQQPNSFNELLLQIAQANGVGGSQQTQTNGQTGQSLPVNVTARAYFDENQKLQQVQSINIWELNGSNENTFNTFGSNEVSARFNNGVQGRVYKIEVTWADGRRFQIEGINTTGNVVIDRPNR